MLIIDTDLNQVLAKTELYCLSFKAQVEKDNKVLWELIDQACQAVANQYELSEVNKQQGISAARQAYKAVGNDPNRYRPSADSLLRRIVKKQGLYKVNNVVDILNLVSIESGLSIGGYDAKKIQGNISMGIGQINEPYKGIGRGELNIANLPVLRDTIGAFGTPTSDSERTMIEVASKEFLFVFYNFFSTIEMDQVTNRCKKLLSDFAQAQDFHVERFYI